ncbi:MAG: enoyl-CoA hydratase-related protein [Nitrospinota bacterium]
MKAEAGEPLLIEVSQGVATLTINRPAQRNAITQSMWREFPGIARSFEEDPAVRVVIIRGSGREAFASGQDISEYREFAEPETAAQHTELVEAAWESIERLSKPSIAMIFGWAMGGAGILAISCDLRFAAENARFGVPSAKLGIVTPYYSVKRLLRLIGPAFTKELLMTGRAFDAQEALRMGLVNRVLPVEIAGNAPLSVRNAKSMVSLCLSPESPEVLEKARAMRIEGFTSRDFREGMQAFLEKRKPRFSGE